MLDRDKWQEIFQTIRGNKMRTVLTAFGVFWGIFMLVVMLGSGSGLENAVLKGFSGYSKNSIYCWGGRTSVPFKGLPPGRPVRFRNADIQALRAEFPEIEYLAPRMGFESLVIRENRSGTFELRGEVPDMMYVEPFQLNSGRFINPLDVNENRKVVVLGKDAVQELFGDEDPHDQYIKIGGAWFRVIGTVGSLSSHGRGAEDNRSIYMPLSTLQQVFNLGDRVGWFIVSIQSDSKAQDMESEIRTFLAKRHDVDPTDKMGVGAFNLGEQFQKFQGLFNGIKTLIWIVGIGTLLAGIVGVSNIMLIIVNDRTRELGIRKSIGASPASVVGLIIQESLFLTILAGLMGLVMGVTMVEGIRVLSELAGGDTPFFYNPEVNLTAATAAMVLLLISGVLAGLMPALRAARIKPVEALKAG